MLAQEAAVCGAEALRGQALEVREGQRLRADQRPVVQHGPATAVEEARLAAEAEALKLTRLASEAEAKAKAKTEAAEEHLPIGCRSILCCMRRSAR